MVVAKNGRSEVQAPGENKIDGITASANDAIKWIIRPGEQVPVRVVEGKSTDVDVRLQDVAKWERGNKASEVFSRAVLEQSSDEHKAITDFEQAIKLDRPYPRNVVAHACLALILATSADDNLRDGKSAIELAQKAQQLEDKPSAFVLEALAAANAEVGDFDRAVANEKQAIELAKKEQRGKAPTEYLKLYEAHKPRRETRRTSDRHNEKKHNVQP